MQGYGSDPDFHFAGGSAPQSGDDQDARNSILAPAPSLAKLLPLERYTATGAHVRNDNKISQVDARLQRFAQLPYKVGPHFRIVPGVGSADW
jgi:hypothetical protein